VYLSARLGSLSDFLEALRSDPASQEAAESVRAAAREDGDFSAYAEAFFERGVALWDEDMDLATDSLVEAALVFEEEVDDLEKAAEAYEAVLELQPDHRRALFALGLILHDLKRWDDLIALYRRRLATSTDGGERTTLHLYIAELLAERKDDADAAFTEVLRAVRLTPTNIRIVTRLEQLGQKTDRVDEVAVAIGDIILHQEDPRVRAALSLRLAELHLGPLGNQQRALAYLKAALWDDGGNPEVLEQIEDVFRERERFDELAEILEVTAKDRRVGPHRVRLERELARIYELELGDLPRALAAITRAVQHATDDRELLDEVMRLGLMSGDLVTVSDTYEDVCEATDNALLRTYMRLKLGHIYGNVLDRAEDAIRVYWAILETEPQHREARRRLMKLHERRGDWDDVAHLLQMDAEEAPDDATAVAIYARIVTLCDEKRVDDPERGVEACRRILEIDPQHELAKRVSDEDEADEAPARPVLDLDAVGVSAVATDATEAPTEFDGEGYGPESETHWSPDAPSPAPRAPAPRVPSTHDLVLEDDGVRLMTPDAPMEDEDETVALDEAPAAGLVLADVPQEAAIVPVERRRPPPPPPRGESAVRDPSVPITGVARVEVMDPDDEPSVGADPAEAEALASKIEAARRSTPTAPPPPPEDADDLEAKIEAARRSTPTPPPPPPEDADDLEAKIEAARLATPTPPPPPPDDAEDLEAKIEAARLDKPTPPPPPPDDAEDLDAKIPVSVDDAEELDAKIDGLQLVERDALSRQIAAAELDSWDSHIDAAEEAQPERAGAAQVVTEQIRDRRAADGDDEAEEPLDEEALAATVDEDGASEDVAGRLAQIQKELAEATEQDDRPKMIELLEEIVSTNERLEQSERAFFSMVRLAQIDPNVDRIEQTIRLGRRAQGYTLLIDTVQGVLEHVSPEQQLRFELKLAEIEADDLGDLSRALERFERLGAKSPTDEAVLGRHLSVLDAAGRHEEVAQVLLARAEATEDQKDKRGFLLRAVSVYDGKLGDSARAADVILEHHDDFADEEEVIAQAAALLTSTERYDDLIALYEKQALRTEGEKLSQLRLDLARLHLEHKADPDASEAELRRGLEERARDPQLLEALEQALLDREKWGEAVDVGMRRLEVLHSAATKNALRKRIARISEEQLASPDIALDMYQGVVADDATDDEAWSHIERLRRAREDWDGVIQALLARVDGSQDAAAQVALLLEASEIQVQVFDDLGAAQAALDRAIQVAPDHTEVLDAMAGLAMRRGEDEQGIAILRRLAEVAPAAESANVHVRIGRMLESQFGDREAAHAEYEHAYQADYECREAILALLDFAEAEDDFIRAHELAAQAARLSQDERDANALFVRAGLLAQQRVGDDLKALEYYEAALAADPDDLSTEATFGELLASRGELVQALPHLWNAAQGLSDPERSAQLAIAAARAADELPEHEIARASYDAVLNNEPTHAEALDRLGALLADDQDWSRVYELGASLVLHHEASLAAPQRSAVYFRMAKAKCADEDFEAAARLAKKAHHLAEREVGPLRLYAEMLEHAGDAFEAAECLKRLAGLLEDESAKKDALVHAGRLLGDLDGDLARASAMLTEAQTYGPEDVELADRLSSYRVQLGDALGGAEALVLPAMRRDGRERADLLVRAARVLLAAGKERGRARELLREALELVPTHAGARADLSVVLEFDGDVDELVRTQLRAADQFVEDLSTDADADGDDRVATATRLYLHAMSILRFHLELHEQALAVCKKVMKIAPETPGLREQYARLLDIVAAKGGPTAMTLSREAIVAWSYLVEQRAGDVEGLERLTVLRRRVGDTQQARVTAEILEALGETPPPEPKNGAAKVERSLDTRVINALRPVEVPFHPGETSDLTELFEALGYAPLKAMADVLPEPRPKKRDLAGAAGLGIHVSRPIGYTARVLGQETPPVYVREDAPAAVNAAFVGDGPALVVSLSKAEQHSIDELRFMFGRCFAMLRPRALMFELIPLTVLREALVGFAKFDDPSEHDVDPKMAKKRGRALERALPANDRAALQGEVRTWLESDDRRSLGEERAGVFRTAERFGLVVSGSLKTSVDVLSSLAGGRVERHWHAPLIRYAITREYHEMLRRLQ
jgi:Tfp pilus assembly protein PilF